MEHLFLPPITNLKMLPKAQPAFIIKVAAVVISGRALGLLWFDHCDGCVTPFSIPEWGNVASVQFSRSVVSDSLQPHESQRTRPPCLSPTPGVHSDSRPSSWWCHPAIPSSVVPFSSCPQSLPASVFSNESTLHLRWPKYWSFSFSINPFKVHPGLVSFRMDRLDLLAVQGTLKSLRLLSY